MEVISELMNLSVNHRHSGQMMTLTVCHIVEIRKNMCVSLHCSSGILFQHHENPAPIYSHLVLQVSHTVNQSHVLLEQ